MDNFSEDRLVEGRKLFIAEFAKKLIYIEQLGVPVDLEGAQEIYRLAHTLKGSAPIFGFLKVGFISEQLAHFWLWSMEDTIQKANYSNEYILFQISQAYEDSFSFITQLRAEYEACLQALNAKINLQMPLQSVDNSSYSGNRLLIIDDDEALRAYLVLCLQSDGYEVDGAANIESAKLKLYENSYDLITLDLRMYPQSGYDLFYFLKDDPTLKWLPLIVISGEKDISDKVRCLHLGADDYVTKPFQYEELSARIYSLLRRTKSFEQMAFRDPLTGVYNRRYFDNQIQLELKRIDRYPAAISIAFIDIDHFKKVNDTYGHAIGDLVLQAMAHTLQDNTRSTDLVARFGGEEFVVVFLNSNEQQAAALMLNIMQKVRNNPITEHQGLAFHITFSAGIAEWQPWMDAQTWIRIADETMYKAKQMGRNQTLISDMEKLIMPIAKPEDSSVRKKILVVDDRMIRTIVVSKLSTLPVDIIEAYDGEEGLEMLKKHYIDLCILDSIMPKLDGFGLLIALKDNDQILNRNMQIIMLSGRYEDADIERAKHLGVRHYMAKPFSVVELETNVKKILQID